MSSSLLSTRILSINCLSILTMSTLRSRSLERDEYPVPKSSTEIFIPMLLSIPSFSFAIIKSSMKRDSVISNSRSLFSMPQPSIRTFMSSTKSERIRSAPEMLTATRTPRQDLSFIIFTNNEVFFTISFVKGVISLFLSATSINSTGDTFPSVSDFILASVSKPVTFPVPASTCGWKRT